MPPDRCEWRSGCFLHIQNCTIPLRCILCHKPEVHFSVVKSFWILVLFLSFYLYMLWRQQHICDILYYYTRTFPHDMLVNGNFSTAFFHFLFGKSTFSTLKMRDAGIVYLTVLQCRHHKNLHVSTIITPLVVFYSNTKNASMWINLLQCLAHNFLNSGSNI